MGTVNKPTIRWVIAGVLLLCLLVAAGRRLGAGRQGPRCLGGLVGHDRGRDGSDSPAAGRRVRTRIPVAGGSGFFW